MEILPTVSDLAQVSQPGDKLRGREVVLPHGKLWASHLEALRSGSFSADNTMHGEDIHVHG